MPSPTIHDNLALLIDVEKKEVRLKALFRAAVRTSVEFETTPDEPLGDEFEAERQLALFWLHFTELQLKDEPVNPLLVKSLQDAQARVDAILQPNDYPWELS